MTPWPESRRIAQAARIREQRPWLQATGPRTATGKSRSSRNASKGAFRPKLRALAQSLRQMSISLSECATHYSESSIQHSHRASSIAPDFHRRANKSGEASTCDIPSSFLTPPLPMQGQVPSPKSPGQDQEQNQNHKQTQTHPADPLANGAKDHVLEVLSHELRMPLTPVLAAAELLGSPFKLSDAEVKKQAELIRRNILHEARLIDDILDLTRLSRGKLQVRRHDVDMHRLINDALNGCQADAHKRGVSFELRTEASNHAVSGDAARLVQVLSNLLCNAAKFSNSGGRVTVRTSNPRPDAICIDVIDEGLGIAADRLEDIFEPFHSRKGGVAPRSEGLGIGLCIAHGLVEVHGGKLTAASGGVGRGATFTIELPVVAPALTQPVDDTPKPTFREEPPSGFTILLVDDHDDTRQALRSLLERRGYQVFVATGLNDATRIASSQHFDLLLSDIGMPDGSGLELMQSLRPSGIKGIAISGHGTDEDLKRSREAGFSDHITKPVSIDDLEATIQQLQGPAPTPPSPDEPSLCA
jgi:CheY-like chemotaxis protein